jgi:hypothetical protein
MPARRGLNGRDAAVVQVVRTMSPHRMPSGFAALETQPGHSLYVRLEIVNMAIRRRCEQRSK